MNALGARAAKGPEHWRAFDRGWFRANQVWLLWALNTPLLGRMVRYILRIDMADVWTPCDTRIVEIAPNRYTVQLPSGQYRTDFRTHWKYSKRLYYAWKPLWWLLHYWDSAFSDRWAPQLSYGFATLTAYPDPDPEVATVDGYPSRDIGGQTWAGLRDGAGNAVDESSGSLSVAIRSGTNPTWNRLRRVIALFDTSSLGSSATISAAVLSLYGDSKSDTAGWAPNLDIYTSSPASNTSLVAGDYSQLGTTSQTGSPISYASFTAGAYNDFTFNATGRSNISKTGISKFGARNGNYDAANSEPSYSASQQCILNTLSADTAGTTSDPKLVVTYSAAAASRRHVIIF